MLLYRDVIGCQGDDRGCMSKTRSDRAKLRVDDNYGDKVDLGERESKRVHA